MKDILTERCVSIKELAEKLDMHRTTISRVVNMKMKGELTRLKICRVLGMSYKDVWGDED